MCIRDSDYLDAYNNVPSMGHCHPHVAEAIAKQAATLNTNTRYAQTALVDYAERLISLFPSELQRVTFACSGSEAVSYTHLDVYKSQRQGLAPR